MQSKIYIDLNNEANPDKTLLTNERAVFQAIENLLLTSLGERLFLPEFGSRLHELPFEPVDEMTAFEIENYIVEAIRRWEPRVDLISTKITPYPDDNAYVVELTFTIRGLEGEYKWEKVIRK